MILLEIILSSHEITQRMERQSTAGMQRQGDYEDFIPQIPEFVTSRKTTYQNDIFLGKLELVGRCVMFHES